MFSVSCRQDGVPVPFRYGVTAKGKVNVFEPAALNKDVDLLTSARATQFGAALIGSLNELPKSIRYGMVWEATLHCNAARSPS